MVDISISKSYLAMVFCLVFGYEVITLIFGTSFWGSQVALVFLIMYLLHEPAHALMAYWYKIDVLEIHLDRRNSYIAFAGIDEKDPKKNEIEGMIFGAGFAVDLAALLVIIKICTIWDSSQNPIIASVPIVFALVMCLIFFIGLLQKDSDFQKVKESNELLAGVL
jgi:O-antigen/teichoic acid export membrane protein